MMRKLWVIPVLAVLLIVLFCCSAAAERTGKLSDTISWHISDTGILSISGTGGTPDYDASDKDSQSPFSGNESIREIFIDEGITELGNDIFYSCTGVTSVSLPDSLRYIGERAFYYNGMDTINIPVAVETIDREAFAHCWHLYRALIHRSDAVIEERCFDNCYTGLYIHGWEESTAEAYADANGINFITWSRFGQCGASVYYFVNPSTGELVITGDGAMDNYWGDTSTPWEEQRDDIRKVTIVDGVTYSGGSAFSSCRYIETVVMADSVTEIGGYAFSGNYSLKNITFSGNLETIGYYAFEFCGDLTSVSLPESLKTIRYAAFLCCGITSVSVSSGPVKTWNFFYPYGAEELDQEPEYNRCFVCRVDLPAGIEDARQAIFAYNPLSHDYPDFFLPSDVTTIGAEALSGTKARFIWLGSDVTTIGSKAFAWCSGLRYVYLPEEISSIGTDAFPEGTVLIVNSAYGQQYAVQNGLEFIMLEDPYGGNG